MNYLKETDYLNIRYQKKPFMLFIWLSAVMLGLGGILGLRDKLKWNLDFILLVYLF